MVGYILGLDFKKQLNSLAETELAMTHYVEIDNETSNPKIEKTYSNPFLLDKAKAARIVDVLEERFQHVGLQFEPHYFIELKRGNRYNFSRIEEVFSLDNTRRNPIKILTVELTSGGKARSPVLACYISFQVPNDDVSNNITIRVNSNEAMLAMQSFAAIEEQVQRTFIEDWIYPFKDITFASLSILFLISLPAVLIARISNSKFSDQQLRSFLLSANNATTSDEKIDFLFDIAKHELQKESASRVQNLLFNLLSIRSLSVILPIFIIIGCTYYVLAVCCPGGVFFWGDYEAHYRQLVSRRNFIFSVVILSVVLGLVTNFLAMGLASYLRF